MVNNVEWRAGGPNRLLADISPSLSRLAGIQHTDFWQSRALKEMRIGRATRHKRDRYWPQQFLYFFPLPQGQGALRPTFIAATFGVGGFSNRVRSAIFSGLSGSISILYFQPFASNKEATSLRRFSVCTVTPAGFLSVPSFAFFRPSKIPLRPAAPTLLRILPMSSILLLIASLFQISGHLSILDK